jgi:hypothetical protein
MDRETDMTMITAAFHNVAKVPDYEVIHECECE